MKDSKERLTNQIGDIVGLDKCNAESYTEGTS